MMSSYISCPFRKRRRRDRGPGARSGLAYCRFTAPTGRGRRFNAGPRAVYLSFTLVGRGPRTRRGRHPRPRPLAFRGTLRTGGGVDSPRGTHRKRRTSVDFGAGRTRPGSCRWIFSARRALNRQNPPTCPPSGASFAFPAPTCGQSSAALGKIHRHAAFPVQRHTRGQRHVAIFSPRPRKRRSPATELAAPARHLPSRGRISRAMA